MKSFITLTNLLMVAIIFGCISLLLFSDRGLINLWSLKKEKLEIQNEINDKTEIIINCAGRTRSIIGAQNLINFGIKNKVRALENGTQGWTLSGYKLENNKTEALNLDKIESQKSKYQNSANKIINKFNLKKINLRTLNSFLEEKTKNTVPTQFCYTHFFRFSILFRCFRALEMIQN